MGLTSQAVERLRIEGVVSQEDLWSRLAEHAEKKSELADELSRLADQMGVQTDELVECLVETSIEEAKGSGHLPSQSLIERYLFDLVLVLALILAGALGMWLRSALPDSWTIREVVAGRELPAFHLLERTDLETRSKLSKTGRGSTSPGDFVGRLTLRPVARGETLRDDILVTPAVEPSEVANRVVLSLPVASMAIAPRPGSRVALLLAPRKTRPKRSLTVPDAIFLAGKTDGSINVAVPRSELVRLGPLLAVSEVFVVQSVSAETTARGRSER